MAAVNAPGGGDPSWPALVEFLSVAGLEGGPLDRVLTLLASEDVTNICLLRKLFPALSAQLKGRPVPAIQSWRGIKKLIH